MGARQGHTASQGSKYFSVSLHPHGDPGPHQPSPAQSCLAPLHPLPPCAALLISASPVLSTQPSSAHPSRRMPAIAHKSVFRKLSSERGPHMPLALCLGRRAVGQAVLPGMASSALWSLEAGLCLWDASLSLTLSSAAGQVAPWLQDSGLQGMGSGGQPGHLAACTLLCPAWPCKHDLGHLLCPNLSRRGRCRKPLESTAWALPAPARQVPLSLHASVYLTACGCQGCSL